MSSLKVSLAHSLKEVVRRLGSRKLDELWICSAYIRKDGVQAVRPLLKARHIRAVLGAGEQTEPLAVKELSSRHVQVRLVQHTAKSEFHPKCYVGLEQGGEAWAVVGSANLTGRGAEGNVELMTVVEGEATDPYFVMLLEWLGVQYRTGHPATDAIMKGITAMFEARGTATTEQLLARKQMEEAFAVAERDRGRRSILTYIGSTKLLTSYKLVILGVLLHAPDGRLPLEECANRFQAFYQALQGQGVPPERRLRGGKQIAMITPLEHDLKRVISLLRGRKDLTIKKRGFVRYHEGATGTQLIAGANLSAAERLEAQTALVERLTAYYRDRVGADRAEGVIRQALLSVSGLNAAGHP